MVDRLAFSLPYTEQLYFSTSRTLTKFLWEPAKGVIPSFMDDNSDSYGLQDRFLPSFKVL